VKTKIWYSVQNCGDGSAYPQFMESEELCKLDQDFMDEGWGEPCIGSIEIEHDGPIKILEKITTLDEVIKECEEVLEQSSDGYKKYTIKKLEALNKLKEKKVVNYEI
jgi:hypothetical protein